jgi:hypothetical protein
MNGLAQRNKTFGELLSELRARLGFVTQGSASKGNEAVLKSYLQEAHEYVYGELEPPALKKRSIITLQANSNLYDWHDDTNDEDIDPGQVRAIHVKVSDTIREPLTQGVTETDRSNASIRQQPSKYDTLDGQLEVWPTPGQPYDLIIEHIAGKGRFERMSDRPSVPDRLVFLYALANAKAHYRHPDAQVPAKTFEMMMSKEKSKQKENQRYFVTTGGASRDAQVARTESGYTLRA